MSSPHPPHIALFIPSFGDGGVGRSFVNLANAFVERGIAVSFIVNQDDGVFFSHLDPKVERVLFRSQDDKSLTGELLHFVREQHPRVVMTGHGRDDLVAIAVRERLRDPDVRFFLRVGTSLAHRAELRSRLPFKQWLRRWQQQRLFARSDGIIANSQGAATELRKYLKTPNLPVAVLPNPTLTPELLKRARAPVEHPWLQPGELPVIMGIGRLGRAKDFPTLLRAFALVREKRPCRLLILGKGRQLAALEQLGRHLGIAENVQFAGFVDNPHAHLARARLFVLSSLWEGCPNALIEALAVGTPAVATDCPSGPREILDKGRYGPLVAPGDPEAMAKVILATLEQPLPAEILRQAVTRYTAQNSAQAYLEAFGLL